ncbi:MAG: tetratricopeptide repeat protein, partial [Paramuribaculum sp.]|nr:tetratricopeptide repeat protein [Paramuribaculum sp.]
MRNKWLLIFAAVCATLLGSCTPKKNTAATRNYQAFITRYNIYFNGDEHYKETLKSMETGYEDDFTKLIPMHPAEARDNKDAPQPNGDFTRSIEKAQKAIQLRSIKKRPQRIPGKSRDPEYREWLKREEYNPFIHN